MEPLVLRPTDSERERLRRSAWMRLANAGAFLLPTLAMLAMWLWYTRPGVKGMNPEGALDPLSADVFSLILPMWVSFGLLGLAVGTACLLASLWSFSRVEEQLQFDEQGVQRRRRWGKTAIPWARIESAAIASDLLVLRFPTGSIKVGLKDYGPDGLDAAARMAKSKLPPERVSPAATGVERAVESVGRWLPFVFGVVVALIIILATYWAFRTPPLPDYPIGG